MGSVAQLSVLITLAWRNLFSHKGKNLIVGLLIFFGAFLLVMGTSLLSSVEKSMEGSITDSLAGHFQVYDADARDELALYGGSYMGEPDIGSMPDFSKVKAALLKVPEVKAVVPMGIGMAEFYVPTELDQVIESLRQALANDDAVSISLSEQRIRKIAEQLKPELLNQMKLSSGNDDFDENMKDVERAMSDELWSAMPGDPQKTIEFLDTKIAPLVTEYEGAMMAYLGTDLPLFTENFDRFEIVKGRMIPEGQRGIVIAEKFWDSVRNSVLAMFEKIHDDLHEDNKTIASDPNVKEKAERMTRQYQKITFQLGPAQAEALLGKLKEFLPGRNGNIDQMVQSFLEVNDDNFDKRYKFFIDEILPMIRSHWFDIGDEITLRTYTKSGYLKSTNIKVWGTYRFKGLEKTVLGGVYNIMDMMTFRDLYGMMTTEKREELKAIQGEMGIKDVNADDVESALFGGDARIEATREQGDGFNEFEGIDLKKDKANNLVRPYTQRDIDNGVALNAAIVLKSSKNLDEARIAIEKAVSDAGLNLKVVDWKKATGTIGQFVLLVQVILYVAILIIFLIALVIINNTMIMSTIERTMEIGTVRAIGGQARFVLALFLIETGLLGIIAGLAGSAAGTALVGYLGTAGIPAFNDTLELLFSGPRLYPQVGLDNLLGAWAVIVCVILGSSFYPAFVATRIQPVVAMQARE